MPPLPTRTVWKTYAYWALWVGVAFFSIYPTCNWLTARRATAYGLYTDWELSLPFIPAFIWVYLSMYVLFLLPPFFLGPAGLRLLGRRLVWATLAAGLAFLLVPGQLGFPRIAPAGDGLLTPLYEQLFAVDLPHNLVPSLHVAFSALILLALIGAAAALRWLWWPWLGLICASTLFVHQHHLLDVFAGLALALACHHLIKKGEWNVQDADPGPLAGHRAGSLGRRTGPSEP